ncbi:acid protease [Cenococcum geophilum 1.58]|uniref:acid protease n=1 Tax=Cenococcum geophilum 1.58 TaxID=794803 RepID=UPI00358F666A|nr:acid protease [Cenococcum geophilum 1.58]
MGSQGDARKLPFAAVPNAPEQTATAIGDEDIGGPVQMIVDSGTTFIYLPNSVAVIVNSLFDPPATFDAGTGLYVVNCSVVAPKFGVYIGGQLFYINPLDMMLEKGLAGICLSAVQKAGGRLAVLGEVFLKNVLAAFDVGAGQMRFAAREDY